MSEYKKPICPECDAGLLPDELRDTGIHCPRCDYTWDWVTASNEEYGK